MAGGCACCRSAAAGDEQPPFEYLDASGNAFTPSEDAWDIEEPPSLQEHEPSVRAFRARPRDLRPRREAFLKGWDGPRERATGLRYVYGEWDVHTTLEPSTLAAAFEERLIRVHGYNTAGAKRRLRAIMPEPLPGTLDGNPVTLGVDDVSRAVGARPGLGRCPGHDDAYTVTVQCGGVPPDSVDLRTH